MMVIPRLDRRNEIVGSASFIERSSDASDFEQVEPQCLDLPEGSENGGAVLKQAREHGLVAFQLTHH